MFGPDCACLVVVGAQWGDEGKGKLVDVLAESADQVVRYQGGANAGHTVVIGHDWRRPDLSSLAGTNRLSDLDLDERTLFPGRAPLVGFAESPSRSSTRVPVTGPTVTVGGASGGATRRTGGNGTVNLSDSFSALVTFSCP